MNDNHPMPLWASFRREIDARNSQFACPAKQVTARLAAVRASRASSPPQIIRLRLTPPSRLASAKIDTQRRLIPNVPAELAIPEQVFVPSIEETTQIEGLSQRRRPKEPVSLQRPSHLI